MTDLKELVGLLGIPVIIALVKATEMVLQLERRWLPMVAIVWGIALNLGLAYILATPYAAAVVWGVIAGLSAVGLFSGTRATLRR